MVRKRPKQMIARVGTKLDYKFSVAEYGSDDQGPFAILNNNGDTTQVVYCTAIDPENQNLVTSMFKPLEGGKTSEEETEATESQKVEGAADEKAGERAVSDAESKPEDSEAKEAATPESVVGAGEKLVTTMDKKQKAKQEKLQKESLKKQKAAEKQAEAARKKYVEPVRVQVSLTVDLTDDERALSAKNAALSAGKAAAEKEAEKLRSANAKANIKKLDADVMRLTEEHNTGVGVRLVVCEQKFDLEKELTWYEYQGKRYELRPMDERERREVRNRGLFGDAPDLPNKVDEKQVKTRTGDELAKDAAAEKEKADAADKKVREKMEAEVKEFKQRKAGAVPPSLPGGGSGKVLTKEDEIRDVMNSEKKRGGKKDHDSSK